MTNDSKAQRRVRATSCPVSSCPAYGQELTDSKEVTLSGSYLIGSPSPDTQPITSLVIGVPKTSNLTDYLAFTHLYTVVPQSYMTPNKSWILLRHQGVIKYAKRFEWAAYNEKRRKTDDPHYRSARGTAFMPAGYVVHVGRAVRLARAFPWIDERHRDGLTLGSIYDPQGGEAFHWQLAMLTPTIDGRRGSKSPFTVIRTSDIQVPSASSMVERQFSNALMRSGLEICSHLNSINLRDGIACPDIIIPGRRLVIEYDGSYWHRGEANQSRDILKSQKFLNSGWRVIRIREKGLDPLQFHAPKFSEIRMGFHETLDELTSRTVMRILR